MQKQLTKIKTDLAFINLAQQSGRHFWLASKNQKAADRLLMFMLAQHGTQLLARFAGTNFQQIPAALYRLKKNNLANTDNLPDYSADGFKKALLLLPAIQRSTGLAEAADYRALQKTSFEQIDSLPAFGKFQTAAAEISARLPLLQRILAKSPEDELDSQASEIARKNAREIQKALAEIQPADLLAAKDLIVDMKRMLPAIKDQEIARQLQLRIKTYEGGLELFGGKMHAHLRNLISEILMRDSFEAGSFARLFRPENLTLASALAAAEAIVSLASAAALTVSGAIVAPCASLTAPELTKEGRQWFSPSPQDKLLAELNRGIEYFDENSGRSQRFALSDLGGNYVKQYAMDLLSALAGMGTGKLLSKAIGRIGLSRFISLLSLRGAKFSLLAIGFQKADLIASQSQASAFVKEYFNQLSVQSNFSTKAEEASEELVIALLEGEYDKTAVLLASLARCTLAGVSYIPKSKFTEFSLKSSDLARAHELLDLQLTQLFKDGYTVRMKGGTRFDAIDASGRITEFRPAAELASQLQDYKAPDWLTNARSKSGISHIHLGELGESLLTQASKQRSVQTDHSLTQEKQSQSISPEHISSIKKFMPEICSAAVAEFKRRVLERQADWGEDLLKDRLCLRQIEAELQDSLKILEQTREQYLIDDQLHAQAQQELSLQKGWFRKPLSERLAAIEHKIAEKVETLEQNHEHEIGRAKQECEKLRQEQETLRLSLERLTEARRLDLQKVLDYMQAQHAWPAVILSMRQDMASAPDNYQFGSGKIFLPKETLWTGKNLDLIIFHEIVHAIQDRHLAEYSLVKTNAEESEATRFYKSLSGRKAEAEFMQRTAENRLQKSFLQADESRLKQYFEDLKRRRSDLSAESEKLFLRIDFIEQRLHSLKRDKNFKGLDNLFNHFDSSAEAQTFQTRLFGSQLTAEVQEVYEEWKSSRNYGTVFLEEAAKRKIRLALELELEQLRLKHARLSPGNHACDRLEQEAYAAESNEHYGILVGSRPDRQQATVTPYEAVQALTAASAKKGDSLHPESRGWEATRKMYDSKIQQGIMSTAQAKKLLSLPAEDREAIEAMLKRDRPALSKGVFAKLLDLESKAFHNLLGVPPTICARVLVPALEGQLIDTQRLDQILNLPDPQRRVAMDFLETAINDPEHAFSAEHLERFMALPPSGRVDIAQAMAPADGSRALSTSELTLALSAPTRTASGKEFCDAATLVKALQRGTLSAGEVKDFASLDENARSGISALLGTNALNRETATLLIQKLQSGELSEVNARDLGVARLVGWLPDGSLEQVLRLDAALRNTLFDRLSAETPRGRTGGFSVPDFIKRQAPLNEMRKQGIINEPTMRLLATPHQSDPLIFDLLNTQKNRAASERITAESIQQLLLLSRAAKMNLETLEAYRLGIERAWLDRNTLKSMLAQKPELKQAAETYMRLAPEKFIPLLKEGRFTVMAAQSGDLVNPALSVFSELFPADGNFDFAPPPGLEKSRESSKVMAEFIEQFNKQDYQAALRTIIDSDIMKRKEIRWVDKPIALYDLNHKEMLEAMASSIQNQGRADGEKKERDPRSSDNIIMSADPLIQLAGKREFRLRDSQQISENGQWRQTSAQEKTFIESIQNSQTGRAILGKTAMVLMTVWTKLADRAKLRTRVLNVPEETDEPGKDSETSPEAAKIAAIVPTLRNVRNLCPDNFASLSRSYSEMEFASGKKAAVSMPPEKFKAIETAYDLYMNALSRASKLSGEERETRMGELAYYFDMEFTSALEYAGIKLGNSTQPYMKPLFEIKLANRYQPKSHSARAPVQPIDMNTEQGLRRYLAEHPQGKKIYRELASVKKSGITPKFDPAPASGRAAKINPQDTRKLTAQQRSALATAILNDVDGQLEGIYEEQESGLLNAELEMTVYKLGDRISHSTAAFNRAEEWTYLMQALNDNRPISQGGNTLAELLDAGEFSELPCSKEMLVSSNDFMQTLLELDIMPDESLWDLDGHYRYEVEERLELERPEDYSSLLGALKQKRGRKGAGMPPPDLEFNRGEMVTYNGELYRLLGREASTEQALVRYEDLAREAAASSLIHVLQDELQSGYQPVLSGNNIHYASKEASDRNIYVLSESEQGEKILHIDSNLRSVPASQVIAVKPESAEIDREMTLGKELALKARDIFDNYKEYSIGISGQQKPLPVRQLIVGRANDAGMKVIDEANYVGARHLQVLVGSDGVAIQDLNSKNGSFLNGRRLEPYETVNLRTTDRITLGASDGPVMALIYKPTDISRAPEYRYMVGDKELMPAQEPLIIGRLATADAFVSDPTVSKVQATLRMTAEGKVMIKDGGIKPSSNGLVVNGEQIIPGSEVELNPGDKVATRTGVILPISYEKKRSRFSLLVETGSGRVNIKDARLAGIPVFLGVDPRHGVYALPKNSDSWIAKRTNKSARSRTFTIKPFKKPGHLPLDSEDLDLPASALRSGTLYAGAAMSPEALEQSNHYAMAHYLDTKIVDGWSSVGRGKTFDSEGNFEAQNRIATTVDRTEDPILRGVLEDSRRRFWHLSPELRARALNEYARELLTPAYLTAEQLDRWYNQFSHDHDGKRVLLGEFIKEAKGVCMQQAILVKVLADEFDDMNCKLVRGLDGCHVWTTFMLSGREIIHDPRGRFISPVAGEAGALPHAIHWLPDAESSKGELAKQIYVKVGDAVSYDGTTGWKVSSYDTLSGEIVLSTDGSRSVSSADLALANPGRTLVKGESYRIPQEEGELLDKEACWTFEGANKDGSLKFFKAGAIEVQARLDQVRLRSERRQN